MAYNDLEKTVLVIEDDSDFRDTLYAALGNDFTFLTADDGEQGIDKLLVHKPDLVVLDLLLPKIDGFEVLKRIREYPDKKISGIPVIVLSNLAGNQDFLKAQKLRIDAYFVKSHTAMTEVRAKAKALVFKGVQQDSEGEVLDFRDVQ